MLQPGTFATGSQSGLPQFDAEFCAQSCDSFGSNDHGILAPFDANPISFPKGGEQGSGDSAAQVIGALRPVMTQPQRTAQLFAKAVCSDTQIDQPVVSQWGHLGTIWCMAKYIV